MKTPPILVGLGAQASSKPEKQETLKQTAPLTPLSKAEKQKAAASVAKVMNAEYPNLITSMTKRVGQRLPATTSGLISVDEGLIGCGGVPRGRIIEIFGPEASGKTTIALQFIAATQQAGGTAAFVDAEHSLDPSHAKRIGVNVDELLISQPDYGEQALEVVEALVDSRAVDIAVIDSVSALVPKAELDGDMGDSHMGLQARLMSQALRKLTGKCNKNGVTLIFINQVREKIGVMFGDPETTTGGRALKFYASLRIKIRQLSKKDGGIIEDGQGTRVGQRSRLVSVKNKCGGAPYAETDLTLMYATGWDKDADLIDFAISLGVADETKGFVTFENDKFRRNDLTDGDRRANIRLAILKVIADKREADAKKEQESLEATSAQ